MSIRKIRKGADHRFAWSPVGYCPETAVTLEIKWPAGVGGAGVTSTYSLDAERPIDVVTGVSSGRLVACTWGGTIPVAPTGFQLGCPEPAYLDLGGFGGFSVRVLRIYSVADDGLSGVLELAEDLPNSVIDALPDGTTGYLVWPYVGTVPSADIPTTSVRPVIWSVAYDQIVGGTWQGQKRVEGQLAVVRSPFDTGLTHGELLGICPAMRGQEPTGQADWIPQIRIALDKLVSVIRKREPTGHEDQVGGSQFTRAHALAAKIEWLVGLVDLGIDRAQALDGARKEFAAELEQAFSGLIWRDENDDGVVQVGETDKPSTWLEIGAAGPMSASPARQTDCRPRRDVRDVW